MSIEEIKAIIPDYGRDIRLNLDSVLAEETAPGLDQGQIWAVALACAYSLGSKDLVEAVLGDGQSHLDDATREAARGAGLHSTAVTLVGSVVVCAQIAIVQIVRVCDAIVKGGIALVW